MKDLGFKEVPLRELRENDYNPRNVFDDAKMADLVESIRKVGLLQPPVIRPVDGGYETMAGVRRLKALKQIFEGRGTILCRVFDATDEEALEVSYRENKDRANLTPMEEARFFLNFLRANAPEQYEEVLEGVVPDRRTLTKLNVDWIEKPTLIEQRLKLLMLPEDAQHMVDVGAEHGGLLLGAAEEIARLRQISRRDKAEEWMRDLAKRYSGKGPNLADLNSEVNRFIEVDREAQERSEKKLAQQRERLEQRAKQLRGLSEKVEKWVTDTFPDAELEEPEVEAKEDEPEEAGNARSVIARADALYVFLDSQVEELRKSAEFDKLTEQQAKLREALARLQTNYEIVSDPEWAKHRRCPFCYAFVDVNDLGRRVKDLDTEIDSIDEAKTQLSDLRSDLEKRLRTLKESRADVNATLEGFLVSLQEEM